MKEILMENLLEQARTILVTTVPRWRALTVSVDEALLNRAPVAGEWSAAECLRHLVEAERDVFPVRVRYFLAGQDFPAYDPDAAAAIAEPRTPPVLMDDFDALRTASLDLLATLTGDDLARTARHAELGTVTLSELIHEWAAHDLMHTVQGERALMQPFIAGCGPWRSYFTDHLAKPASQ
jgi:DinB family protein